MSDQYLNGNMDRKLSDNLAQSHSAQLNVRAERVVEDWKAAYGKPMLSPEAAHDLAARIVEAMVWARVGFRANADLASGSEAIAL